LSTAIFASAAASMSAARYDSADAHPEPVPSGVRAVQLRSTAESAWYANRPAVLARPDVYVPWL
jgi:hypothetical protein